MLTTTLPRRAPGPILLCLVLLAVAGCAPFAPGADKVIVNSQRSIAASFDTVDAFVQFDSDHRAAMIANAPQVHAVAERLRRDAPATFRQADEAVRTYKAVKSTENKSKLDSALDLVEAFARQARAALTEAQAKGIGT